MDRDENFYFRSIPWTRDGRGLRSRRTTRPRCESLCNYGDVRNATQKMKIQRQTSLSSFLPSFQWRTTVLIFFFFFFFLRSCKVTIITGEKRLDSRRSLVRLEYKTLETRRDFRNNPITRGKEIPTFGSFHILKQN